MIEHVLQRRKTVAVDVQLAVAQLLARGVSIDRLIKSRVNVDIDRHTLPQIPAAAIMARTLFMARRA